MIQISTLVIVSNREKWPVMPHYCLALLVFFPLFIIFLLSLVDPNILVTRSMPISSIYRIKELSQIPASLTLDCVVTRGIQLRSVTSEVSRYNVHIRLHM